MAKLFEEVVCNGAVHSGSADIFINFAAGPASDHAQSLLASPSSSAPCGGMAAGHSSSPERGPGGFGMPPISPRAAWTAHSSSSVSPPRTKGACHGHESASSAAPISFRCHSLVLRTQAVLFEKLLSQQDNHPSIVSDPFGTQLPQGPAAADLSALTAPGLPSIASSGFGEGSLVETAAATSEIVAGSSTSTSGVPDLVEISSPRSSADGSVAALPCPRTSSPARSIEVTVDDEPEVFLEMLKFVYLSTCHVDQANVKALIHIADKYCIEDIVTHCLQWVEDYFTAALFFQLLNFQLSNEHFGELLRHSLMRALQSRRHFSAITAITADERWEKLQVSFVEALLSCDELPVVSEMEVIYLLARWAKRALARQELNCTEDHAQSCTEEHPNSASDSDGGTASRARCGSDRNDNVPASAPCDLFGDVASSSSGENQTGKRQNGAMVKIRRDMLKLLRAVRKSNMPVKLLDIEPILHILGMSQLFSTKTPRAIHALDPGFMIYRGVPGVNAPSQAFGELIRSNVVPHAWKGGSVSLGSCDFVRQQEGFRPNLIPEAGISTFPHLCVCIACSSWSHREKRTSKGATSRHNMSSIDGKLMGADLQGPTWDLPSLGESQGLQTLNLMQPDDWDIGRTKPVRASNSVPDLTNAEKIEHKVICAVISGDTRYGIRIGQRERSSIYDVEDLSGEKEGICLGGSPTEVEFELLLQVRAPSPCGICCCTLVVLKPEDACSHPPEPLMEVSFDASAEEPLHFHLSSSHFDSNSTYSVDLNWVMRHGLKPDGSHQSCHDAYVQHAQQKRLRPTGLTQTLAGSWPQTGQQ